MKVCCDTFSEAMQSGTDNEAYGSLVKVDGHQFTMGCGMPEVKFCPWCGSALKHPNYCTIDGGGDLTFSLVTPKATITEKCREIWENPDRFSSEKAGTSSAYYNFLKHIYVHFHGEQRTERLADLAMKEVGK